VVIRWLDPAPVPGSTLVLDVTPGSAGVNADAILTLGRTWSDPGAGLHVTPTAAAKILLVGGRRSRSSGAAFPTTVPR